MNKESFTHRPFEQFARAYYIDECGNLCGDLKTSKSKVAKRRRKQLRRRDLFREKDRMERELTRLGRQEALASKTGELEPILRRTAKLQTALDVVLEALKRVI